MENKVTEVVAAQIPDFAFCPADVEILERIGKAYGTAADA